MKKLDRFQLFMSKFVLSAALLCPKKIKMKIFNDRFSLVYALILITNLAWAWELEFDGFNKKDMSSMVVSAHEN